jgi:beta-glucosidase
MAACLPVRLRHGRELGRKMEDISMLRAQMTLEEKASLCSGLDFWHLKGIERLDIPSIMVTDGPHGLRKQVADSSQVCLESSVPATCFPTASTLAATWNRELIYQVGRAIGEECRAEKVGVILGPGANIKRSPLCGRNFEYFSEDPYLSGEIARSHINGIQSMGIGTSLKHYAANNQESRRMVVDAVVDERALREIYLAGFEIAVKGAQPWTVMSAYNKVNGIYCSEHQALLRDILRDEWGHEGLVITDWGAMNDRVAGLAAGVAVAMPGPNPGSDARIVHAVQRGLLDEAVLDEPFCQRAALPGRRQFAHDPYAARYPVWRSCRAGW